MRPAHGMEENLLSCSCLFFCGCPCYPSNSFFTRRKKGTQVHANAGITPSPLVAQMRKNRPAMQRPGYSPYIEKIPWRREWLPIPVFLPGEFCGQKRLAGYSPWGCKESGHNWASNTITFTFTGVTVPLSDRRLCKANDYSCFRS